MNMSKRVLLTFTAALEIGFITGAIASESRTLATTQIHPCERNDNMTMNRLHEFGDSGITSSFQTPDEAVLKILYEGKFCNHEGEVYQNAFTNVEEYTKAQICALAVSLLSPKNRLGIRLYRKAGYCDDKDVIKPEAFTHLKGDTKFRAYQGLLAFYSNPDYPNGQEAIEVLLRLAYCKEDGSLDQDQLKDLQPLYARMLIEDFKFYFIIKPAFDKQGAAAHSSSTAGKASVATAASTAETQQGASDSSQSEEKASAAAESISGTAEAQQGASEAASSEERKSDEHKSSDVPSSSTDMSSVDDSQKSSFSDSDKK